MTLLNSELHINVSILKENICYLKTKIDKKSTKALQTKLEELEQERDELEFERDTSSEGGIAWYKTEQAGYKKDIRDLNNQLKKDEEDFKNYPTSTEYVTDLKNKNAEAVEKLNSELTPSSSSLGPPTPKRLTSEFFFIDV